MTPLRQFVYINGSRVAQLAIQANDTGYHNQGLILGAGDFRPKFEGHFNGTLDDVRIYDRALTAVEVMQLYDFERQPGSAATAIASLKTVVREKPAPKPAAQPADAVTSEEIKLIEEALG